MRGPSRCLSMASRFREAYGTEAPRIEGEAVSEGVVVARAVGGVDEEANPRIIAATIQCVAEIGYIRMTIREIARTADMASGSVYNLPYQAEIVKVTSLEVSETTMPRLTPAAERGQQPISQADTWWIEIGIGNPA